MRSTISTVAGATGTSTPPSRLVEFIYVENAEEAQDAEQL